MSLSSSSNASISSTTSIEMQNGNLTHNNNGSITNDNEDRKINLLETLVNDQKHLIQLLTMLNNNVEDLMLDIRDLKAGSNNSNIFQSTHVHHNQQEQSIKINDTSALIEIRHQQQQQNQLLQNMNQNNRIVDSVVNPSLKNMHFKSNILREFSTFVSKMVRQEFGCNYLAMTRVNELDRYTMQRIKEEAVSKFLPPGVSPQFAWNHAMNSLRQLRHRQCKKAKALDSSSQSCTIDAFK